MARVAAALGQADTSTSLDSVTYELVASGGLPVLDMSRSVRSVWLPPRFAAAWATFIRRFHAPILLGVYASLLLDFLSVCLPATSGRWCAVLALVLGTPGCVVRITLLRSDAVRLLLATYEYWFFTLTSVVAIALLGVYLGDARATFVPGMWIGFQSCILVDADVASARHYMNATAAMLAFITALTALVFLELVDDVNHIELVRAKMRTVSIETALANAGVIVIVMLSRNLYRRRAAAKRAKTRDSHVNTVFCITYRCRIQLVRVESLDAVVPVDTSAPLTGDNSHLHGTMSDAAAETAATTTLTRLELVKVEHQFSAARVVWPALQRFLLQRGDVPWLVRTAALALAATGAVTSVLSVALTSVDPTARLELQVAALASSSVVVFAGVCLLQREMLKRLVCSFDFAFLSIQLTLAHTAACDLLSYDGRCLVVTASWLWMHLVLSLDALTPLVKARWHFRVRFATPVLFLFLAAQIAMAAAIVLDGDYNLRDRVVYRVHAHRRTVSVKVAAFIISRVATLLGWSLRMLWRIWHQRGDELILLHGSVCYETKLAQVRRRKTDAMDENRAPRTGAAAVAPMAPSAIAGAGVGSST